tara:strand:- start:649 stop:789 length:141 start_codon:yes stop_codon:yes gene_type:complete
MTEEKENPFNKTYEQHIAEILKKQKQIDEVDEKDTSEENNDDKESE